MLLGSVAIGNAWWWDECKTKYPIVLVHGAFSETKHAWHKILVGN